MRKRQKKVNKYTNKLLDLAVIILLILAFPAVVILFNLKFPYEFMYSIFSCGLPALYLILREKKNMKKIILAILIIGGIYGPGFDFTMTFNKAWYVTSLAIPYRIFGVLPLDDVLFSFMMTLITVVFYEHFLDDEKNKKISKNLLWSLAIPGTALVYVTLLKLITGGNPFRLPYAYLLGGSAAIVLPVILCIYKPKLVYKFFLTAVFFSFVWFTSEIAALKTGGWIFPGEYIGMVTVLGVTFPFEEFIFWMLMYSASLTAYYELFIDDMK